MVYCSSVLQVYNTVTIQCVCVQCPAPLSDYHDVVRDTFVSLRALRCVTFLSPERYHPAVLNISGCTYISLDVHNISSCTYKERKTFTKAQVRSMDDNCGEWVECMGVASGCGYQEAGVASRRWVWLVGVGLYYGCG